MGLKYFENYEVSIKCYYNSKYLKYNRILCNKIQCASKFETQSRLNFRTLSRIKKIHLYGSETYRGSWYHRWRKDNSVYWAYLSTVSKTVRPLRETYVLDDERQTAIWWRKSFFRLHSCKTLLGNVYVNPWTSRE